MDDSWSLTGQRFLRHITISPYDIKSVTNAVLTAPLALSVLGWGEHRLDELKDVS